MRLSRLLTACAAALIGLSPTAVGSASAAPSPAAAPERVTGTVSLWSADYKGGGNYVDCPRMDHPIDIALVLDTPPLERQYIDRCNDSLRVEWFVTYGYASPAQNSNMAAARENQVNVHVHGVLYSGDSEQTMSKKGEIDRDFSIAPGRPLQQTVEILNQSEASPNDARMTDKAWAQFDLNDENPLVPPQDSPLSPLKLDKLPGLGKLPGLDKLGNGGGLLDKVGGLGGKPLSIP
ncbi:hypothetical protein [Streptomyces sp. ME19-01-6]|uniref:hypothetical protein n=1 Tax=Streptomyces sp. ME19-01-6 TaxID=3028686 RepID=UPI0029BF3A12|nr:hypothetical protein [Streptomyces sp. ME19-01-6]MDX3225565.1 hypothetical protein [Streptomyces sp. ME19-01-6]